jgi:hypothetical protein
MHDSTELCSQTHLMDKVKPGLARARYARGGVAQPFLRPCGTVMVTPNAMREHGLRQFTPVNLIMVPLDYSDSPLRLGRRFGFWKRCGTSLCRLNVVCYQMVGTIALA